jgi:copper chaperone CopZ
MVSVHCTRAVFTALAPVAGILRADVAIGRATIEHDGRATLASLRDALAQAGYEIEAAEEDRRGMPVLPGTADTRNGTR